MTTKSYIVPVFVPHQGCPHDCVFCNQRNITGYSNDMSLKDVEVMINTYLDDINKKTNEKYVEIAFYGGSFTGIEYSLQEEYLNIAYKKKKAGLIDGIRLSTRPDYIDENIISLLKKYGVTSVELGVQSLDERVLFNSNRGHTLADIIRASNLIKAAGFNLGLQMMIGLPGDDGIASCISADKIITLKPDFIRIYPTLVIKDTELENLYKKKLYTPLSVDQAVNLTLTVYKKFLAADIKVIRIGLQPTDDLSNGCSLEAGPYHPAFRQLVESTLYRDAIDEYLDDFDYVNDLKLYVPSKEISNAVGLNRSNLNYFEEKYDLSKISVYSEEIGLNKIKLELNGEKILINKF